MSLSRSFPRMLVWAASLLRLPTSNLGFQSQSTASIRISRSSHRNTKYRSNQLGRIGRPFKSISKIETIFLHSLHGRVGLLFVSLEKRSNRLKDPDLA